MFQPCICGETADILNLLIVFTTCLSLKKILLFVFFRVDDHVEVCSLSNELFNSIQRVIFFPELSSYWHSLSPQSFTLWYCSFLTITLPLLRNTKGLPSSTNGRFKRVSILLYSDGYMGYCMIEMRFNLSYPY